MLVASKQPSSHRDSSRGLQQRRRVRAALKTHGLGASTATLALTLLEALAQTDVGGASKAAPRKWLDEHKEDTHASPEQTMFRHFKLQTFIFTDKQLRTVTLKALEQVGAECKPGAAPPGPLWDELAEWADALE